MPIAASPLIDDFSHATRASNGQRWRCVSDRVMGGVSTGFIEGTAIDGRHALRLCGEVSLENNGGFLQANLDLADDGGTVDASAFAGIAITLHGDGGCYAVNLRTARLTRPWQSYRAEVTADAAWQEYRLRFTQFVAHRTELPLDVRELRRVGLIAIGEARTVDVAIGRIAFFTE
jgi:hypothetical protein